jgi:adenylosuccinate synthase
MRISINLTGKENNVANLKVGQMYFYLKGWPKTRFGIKEMHNISEYCMKYVVYLSLQEIKDEEEFEAKYVKLREDFFGSYRTNRSFTLEQLRKVYAVIYETKE